MKIVKDARPQIGIFQYVNGQLYSLVEDIEDAREVNGYADAGNLFHLDLLKSISHLKTIDKDLAEKLRTARTPYEWPRGRVCYDFNADTFEVFGPKELIGDATHRKEIAAEFNLPATTKWYIDPTYQFS